MRNDILALIFKSVSAQYRTSKKHDSNPGSSTKTIYLFSLVALVASCHIRHAEEDTIFKTVASLEMLSHNMDSLKSVNDSIWNQVSRAIEKTVPADLPPAEKRNLLAVKNADLIQMFEVYDSFDDPLKSQVMEAGKSDQKIAQEMRSIMTRVDELNKILTQSLSALEKKDPAAYEQRVLHKLNIDDKQERITP